eukprot:403336635
MESYAAMMPKSSNNDDTDDNKPKLQLIPESEIERQTLSEDLSEVERIKILLEKQANKETTSSEMFTILLRNNILYDKYYKELKLQTKVMLTKFDKKILQKWSVVYSLIIPKIIATTQQDDQERIGNKILSESLLSMEQMLGTDSPVKVKESCAFMIGQLCLNKSFKSLSIKETSEKFLKVISQLLDDSQQPSVQSSMIKQLLKFSQFLKEIGQEQNYDSNEILVQIYLLVSSKLHETDRELQRMAIKSIMKHVIKVYNDDFIQSLQTLVPLSIEILQISCENTCPLTTKSTVLKHLNAYLTKLPRDQVHELVPYLKELLAFSVKFEFSKGKVCDIFGSLTSVFSQAIFYQDFYEIIVEKLLKPAILSFSSKETQIAIAQNIHWLVDNLSDTDESNQSQYLQIIELYNKLLHTQNREVLNELIAHASKLIKNFYETRDSLINQDIKNKFYTDLVKYLFVLAVKKIIAEIFAERQIINYSKFLNDQSESNQGELKIEQIMNDQIATAQSSQIRQVYLYFIESLLNFNQNKSKSANEEKRNKISDDLKITNDQIVHLITERYFESLITFKNDKAMSILIHYIKIVGQLLEFIQGNQMQEEYVQTLKESIQDIKERQKSAKQKSASLEEALQELNFEA